MGVPEGQQCVQQPGEGLDLGEKSSKLMDFSDLIDLHVSFSTKTYSYSVTPTPSHKSSKAGFAGGELLLELK